MYTPAALANPFALLMDPDTVFKTLANSGHLDRLQSRVCRPLDKPLIPRASHPEFDDDADIGLDTDVVRLS